MYYRIESTPPHLRPGTILSPAHRARADSRMVFISTKKNGKPHTSICTQHLHWTMQYALTKCSYLEGAAEMVVAFTPRPTRRLGRRRTLVHGVQPARGRTHATGGRPVPRLAHGARLPDQTPASPCPPRPRPRPPPARHPRAIPCHTIVPSLHMSRVAGACRRFGTQARGDGSRTTLPATLHSRVRPPCPHPPAHSFCLPASVPLAPSFAPVFSTQTTSHHMLASPHRSSTCAGNLLDLPAQWPIC